jgi:UDP-N-acetylmuramyl pentapeptide phosphotransferase/UDP-N-acetylglucosamine-1-phosphate transferase
VIPYAASADWTILFHARRDRVAETLGKWHKSHMANQPQTLGGGVFIVIAIAIGTAVGVALGQPSAGVVAGIAVGAVIAIAIWRRDRKRTGR